MYADLHCDTLTECLDRGYSLSDCNLQTNFQKLKKSGCTAQCFAVFLRHGAVSDFKRYADFFLSETKKYGVKQILCSYDLKECSSKHTLGAILTIENSGFLNGTDITVLKDYGVKMASLVWNEENLFAYPNICGGERQKMGLKKAGKELVSALDGSSIIVDISHLSDGGAEEILDNRKIPLVASHSNADFILKNERNLTDSLIKKIADCGGVIGVNFYKKFLGGPYFENCIRHIRHLINTGGENCVAIGSDFDGVPEIAKNFKDCFSVAKLLECFPYKTAQKIAYGNFFRVFEEICG